VRFLWYAKRSGTELQSQLYRALDRQYCSRIKFDELYALIRQTKAKIAALIRYLKDNKDPNKA
jgi:four helix bundle protein